MKLIKFGANWCGSCKLQHNEFSENPIDCEVQEIDIDDEENAELITEYKVRSIPLSILVEGDTEIHRWVGFTKSSIINEFIRANSSKGE